MGPGLSGLRSSRLDLVSPLPAPRTMCSLTSWRQKGVPAGGRGPGTQWGTWEEFMEFKYHNLWLLLKNVLFNILSHFHASLHFLVWAEVK